MEKNKIKFKATVYKAGVDRHGEMRVTFEVPLSDRDKALLCVALTETVVSVSVEPEDSIDY